jgi:hypothetical protein
MLREWTARNLNAGTPRAAIARFIKASNELILSFFETAPLMILLGFLIFFFEVPNLAIPVGGTTLQLNSLVTPFGFLGIWLWLIRRKYNARLYCQYA